MSDSKRQLLISVFSKLSCCHCQSSETFFHNVDGRNKRRGCQAPCVPKKTTHLRVGALLDKGMTLEWSRGLRGEPPQMRLVRRILPRTNEERRTMVPSLNHAATTPLSRDDHGSGRICSHQRPTLTMGPFDFARKVVQELSLILEETSPQRAVVGCSL